MFVGKAEEEDSDVGVRSGDRVRRPHGTRRFGPIGERGGAAHLMAARPFEEDQHRSQPVPGGRRHPRLRIVSGGPAADLHGGRGPPQRGRQNRRLHVPQ